jgi:hypothetical protein
MAATVPAAASTDVEVFRHLAGMIRQVVRLNADGLSQQDSLAHPDPAGNCANWVVGHLLCIYNRALGLLGQERVMDEAALARYDRGSPPLENPDEALDLGEMMATWDETCRRVDAGLANLTSDALDQAAAFSPSGNPNETVRSLVSTILFHQSYHAGQLGVLRRVAGKPGAIA